MRARSSPCPNAHIQPSVGSAVIRLLTSIKDLVESLEEWSQQRMTDVDVSDVYVRLVNDFNEVVVTFAAHEIEMTLVPPSSHSSLSPIRTPPPLKLFRVLGSSFLSLKIFETYWSPV